MSRSSWVLKGSRDATTPNPSGKGEETTALSSGYRKERSWGRKRPLCAVQSGGRELLFQDTVLCPGPHPGSGSLVLGDGAGSLPCLIRTQDAQQWRLLGTGVISPNHKAILRPLEPMSPSKFPES